jgi:hypothetical protein
VRARRKLESSKGGAMLNASERALRSYWKALSLGQALKSAKAHRLYQAARRCQWFFGGPGVGFRRISRSQISFSFPHPYMAKRKETFPELEFGGRGENPAWANLQSRQGAVNGNAASLQTKDREAVEVSLPISMHAGQIIMLTKMFTASDLRFYDFPSGVTVKTWRSDSD